MQRPHLEAWFGLNPNQPERVSGFRGRIRLGEAAETWEARFEFGGGRAQPGRMVYTRIWFRLPEPALGKALPTVRFDVLDGQTIIAVGEIVSR